MSPHSGGRRASPPRAYRRRPAANDRHVIDTVSSRATENVGRPGCDAETASTGHERMIRKTARPFLKHSRRGFSELSFYAGVLNVV